MEGGSGSDTYYVDEAGDAVVETDNAGLVSGKYISGPIDLVISSISYLLGSFVENLQLKAGAGNLTGFGNALDNVMVGNEGDNLLYGDAGDDELTGGPGDDVLSGDTGTDTALYTNAGSAVSVSLALLSVAQATGGAGTDTLISIEALVGSGFADSLTGSAGNDNLSGGNGKDTIHGGTGNDDLRGNDQADRIYGEDGNDFLGGGKGHDSLDGGESNDTLAGLVGNDTLAGGNGIDLADYSGSPDAVTVNLLTGTGGSTVPVVGAGSGVDVLGGIENILGGDFNDVLAGDTLDNALTGGNGNDTLSGDTGFDTLNGGDGDDSLLGGLQKDEVYGGNGNDTVAGGNGFDTLDGGEGNDSIRGALGTDVLTGGNGADRFVFATALDGILNIDTITDFTSGVDVIELSAAIFGVFTPDSTPIGLNVNLTYNVGTGGLQYDADGAGANPGITFAILGTSSHPALANDFLITA
jgi:Ca2+-binding RTX toxin-like protein